MIGATIIFILFKKENRCQCKYAHFCAESVFKLNFIVGKIGVALDSSHSSKLSDTSVSSPNCLHPKVSEMVSAG